jgi:2-keto-myo-inositol isomerase
MPIFGLNSWTVGDDPAVATILDATARAGFDFVELRDVKIEQHLAAGGTIAGLRALSVDAGVRILSVNTLDDATLHTGVGLDRMAERCRRLCDWSAGLDSPVVIAGPSYLADAGDDRSNVRARTLDSLARYAAIAAEHDVRIGFEFHGYARASINTLAETVATLDALGDARVGLVADAFHFYAGGSSFDDLAALDPARLLIVHLADVDRPERDRLAKGNRVMPGDGVLPVATFVDTIRATGYSGAYSLELFRPEYWAMAPLAVAERGLESMRRFVLPAHHGAGAA